MGSPIRISTDLCVLTAPRSISLLVASFIGCWCQGIPCALFLSLPYFFNPHFCLFSKIIFFFLRFFYTLRQVLFNFQRSINCHLQWLTVIKIFIFLTVKEQSLSKLNRTVKSLNQSYCGMNDYSYSFLDGYYNPQNVVERVSTLPPFSLERRWSIPTFS